jgi:hypothetical protein
MTPWPGHRAAPDRVQNADLIVAALPADAFLASRRDRGRGPGACSSRVNRPVHERDFCKEIVVTVERALRLIAGTFVSLSVLLGIFVNAHFLWFTLFVGLNLFQSGLTNWCPMMVILRKGGLADAGHPGEPITTRR